MGAKDEKNHTQGRAGTSAVMRGSHCMCVCYIYSSSLMTFAHTDVSKESEGRGRLQEEEEARAKRKNGDSSNLTLFPPWLAADVQAEEAENRPGNCCPTVPTGVVSSAARKEPWREYCCSGRAAPGFDMKASQTRLVLLFFRMGEGQHVVGRRSGVLRANWERWTIWKGAWSNPPQVRGLAFANKHVYVNVGRGAGEWSSASGVGGGV